MAFEGGPLSTIGITPEYLTGLATQTAGSGVSQVLGQVWKGSGQSFFGRAGQGLSGGLAGSAVNIALNSAFGSNVPGPSGFTLNSGRNLLASTITPYVTGNTAAGINQQIQQTLQSAGPFGPALSSAATGLVNTAIGGITNSIFAGAAGGTNFKMFPGGGGEGEAPADYGGSAYTLTDVTFSLQPANQGPQTFGSSSGLTLPKSLTTLPFDQLSSMPPLVPNETANVLKAAGMADQIGQKAFSSNLTSTFRVN